MSDKLPTVDPNPEGGRNDHETGQDLAGLWGGPRKMWLSDLSIRQPVFILMLVSALMLAGWLSYTRMAVEMTPDISFPIAVVQTVYPGADPQEVERSVTRPIEDAVSSINQVENVRSISMDSVSLVIVEFAMSADPDKKAEDVRNRVNTIRNSLPADVKEPVIEKLNVSAYPILVFAVSDTSGRRSPEQLRTLVDDVVKPGVEKVAGVASVDVVGGLVRQVQVNLDLDRMRAHGVSPQQVVQAIRAENLGLPAGRMKDGGAEEFLRTAAELNSLEQLGEVLVPTSRGSVARVRELASISEGFEEVRALSRLDGVDSVVAKVQKQSGTNTVRVAESAKAALQELRRDYPDLRFGIAWDQSVFTRESVQDVQTSIILGAILASLVVLFFFRDLRNTLVTVAGLPVILLGTFAVLYWQGISLNMLSLMALSLSIGMLIDDAIVVRENIFRHMERGEEPRDAAGHGTAEIALAVVAITSTIVAVFLPIAFTGGIAGKYMRDFGITVAAAVLISLVEAFTLAPMLSAHFFHRVQRPGPDRRPKTADRGPLTEDGARGDAETRRDLPLPAGEGRGEGLLHLPMGEGRGEGTTQDPGPRTQDSLSVPSPQSSVLSPGLGSIYRAYRSLLAWSLWHRWLVVGVGVLALVACVGMAPMLNQSFQATVDQGECAVMLELKPGARLEDSDQAARTVEEMLRADPLVDHLFTNVGSSDGEVNQAAVGVKLKTRGKTNEFVDRWRVLLGEALPEVKLTWDKETAAASALGGAALSALRGRPIQFSVLGRDFQQLDQVSAELMARLEKVPDVVDVDRSLRPPRPERVVVLDRARAADLGVSAAQVASSLRMLVTGERAGSFRGEEKDLDIVVRLSEQDRDTPEEILRLPILTGRGAQVSLATIADLRPSTQPNQISRENRQRQVTVSSGFAGQDVGPVLTKAQAAVESMSLPAGVSIKVAGEAKYTEEIMGPLGLAMILSVAFMYMILASQFGSLTQPFLIMLALPFAMVGALLALLVTRVSLNAMVMIAFLLLMGLVAKNSILVVEFTNQLRRRGLSTRDAILLAGPIRLRPILMTTAAMVFGMLPVAAGLGAASELRQPMGISVIGGVLTSTLLSLVVVPVAYSLLDDAGNRLGRLLRRRRAAAPEVQEAPEKESKGAETHPPLA